MKYFKNRPKCGKHDYIWPTDHTKDGRKINMHKETVTLILTKDMKMKVTYAKIVTENQSDQEKKKKHGSKTKNLSEKVAIRIK